MTAPTANNSARRSPLHQRPVAAIACLSSLGLAALAWATFAAPLPRLVYNPSDSVPIGWYLIDPIAARLDRPPPIVQVGDVVLVRLAANVAMLASQRGYLPAHIPLLKRVAAVAPQRVCVTGHTVRIDSAFTAYTLAADRLGRPLQAWSYCRRLRQGELFLLGATNPSSFDSRYFGPVSTEDLIGAAHPLRLKSAP